MHYTFCTCIIKYIIFSIRTSPRNEIGVLLYILPLSAIFMTCKLNNINMIIIIHVPTYIYYSWYILIPRYFTRGVEICVCALLKEAYYYMVGTYILVCTSNGEKKTLTL